MLELTKIDSSYLCIPHFYLCAICPHRSLGVTLHALSLFSTSFNSLWLHRSIPNPHLNRATANAFNAYFVFPYLVLILGPIEGFAYVHLYSFAYTSFSFSCLLFSIRISLFLHYARFYWNCAFHCIDLAWNLRDVFIFKKILV